MSAKPIIFSASMVRAILEERKTMTRRVIKPQPGNDALWCYANGKIILHDIEDWETGQACGYGFESQTRTWKCPYGEPGDTLWVKETFFVEMPGDYMFEAEGLMLSEYPEYFKTQALLHYKATTKLQNPGAWKWRPSLFMPRWASRINLVVETINVQRLQDISEEDAYREGFSKDYCGGGCTGNSAKTNFGNYWDTINTKKPGCSWNDNPWVWAVEFDVPFGADFRGPIRNPFEFDEDEE